MKNPTAAETRMTPATWGMLILLAAIWGGSFTANRAALAELGVLTTVAIRVSGAAMLLWLWIWARGLPVPKESGWIGTCLIMGTLNNILPFNLIVWGQTHVPSGLAGILNSATAIFSVVLAAMVYPDERLTLRRAIGAGLGLAGVIVTIGVAKLGALDLTSVGQLAIVAAALSYATAAVFARRAFRGVRPEVSAAGMLSAAAVVMLPVAVAREGVPTLSYAPATWAALFYLACIASALAYFLFYAILKRTGAGNLGFVTLLLVPFAILFGVIFFGESLSPQAYLGFGLLALGMAVLDGRVLAKFS